MAGKRRISLRTHVLLVLPLIALAVGVLWPRPEPALANPLTGIAALAGGRAHTCALMATGDVKCWGDNYAGQLGDGTRTGQTRPVDVVGPSVAGNTAAIAAGSGFTCAVTVVGGLHCWGGNYYGQLGYGTTGDSQSGPVPVLGLDSGAAGVAGGDAHSCAVTTAGGAKCWGVNSSGQLGATTTEECESRPSPVPCSSTPLDVAGLTSGVLAIAAGDAHTCALTSAGGVKCWGDNSSGQLGDGTLVDSSTPVDVVGLDSGVAAISAGGGHTCALTAAGGVQCWGSNFYGQLGEQAAELCGDVQGFPCSTTPIDVSALGNGVATIDAGGAYTCAVLTSGGAKCWGANYGGQLGNGTTVSSTEPVQVTGLDSGVAALMASWSHTCAVTLVGGAKCWGDNYLGQLGDGTTRQRLTPVDVATPTKPPPVPTPGADDDCIPARPHDVGDFFDSTITTSDGLERQYLLHVPPSYTGADALPLVFYLHGTGGTTGEAYGTDLPQKADEAGFILVGPQGTANAVIQSPHWNFNMLEQYVDPATPDDVAFIGELVDALEAELCVDAARVYATGFSSGGLMSSRLGCNLADRIAAVAPISGVYFPPFALELQDPPCASDRPMPIVAFHGTADPCIVFEGGPMDCGLASPRRFTLRGVEDEIMPDWAEHNGCDSEPSVERPMENLHAVRYQGCDEGADAVLYAFEGGPHTWYQRYPGWDEFSSVDVLWDFFLAHPMPAAAPEPTATTAVSTVAPAVTLAATGTPAAAALPSAGDGTHGRGGARYVLIALGAMAAGAAIAGLGWRARSGTAVTRRR